MNKVITAALAAIALLGTAMAAVAQERLVEGFEIEAMESHLLGLEYDLAEALTNARDINRPVDERRQWGYLVDTVLEEIRTVKADMQEAEARLEQQEEIQAEPTLSEKYGIGQGGVNYESSNPRHQEEQRMRKESTNRAVAKMRSLEQESVAAIVGSSDPEAIRDFVIETKAKMLYAKEMANDWTLPMDERIGWFAELNSLEHKMEELRRAY